MSKTTVAIIGDRNVGQAKLFRWGDEFYPGDFDSLIIDMTSLSQEKLNQIYSENEGYFNDLRRHIREAQSVTGLMVFCIMEKVLTFQDTPLSEKVLKEQSNYSWSPIIPLMEPTASSKLIDRESTELFPGYAPLVKSWDMIYRSSLNNTGYATQQGRDLPYIDINSKDLLKNNIGKAIAFWVNWTLRDRYGHSKDYSRAVMTFLPKPESMDAAITSIINQVQKDDQEDIPAPKWINTLQLPTENLKKQEITDLKSKLDEINLTIETAQAELRDIESYKGLLFLHDKSLEKIIDKSFKLLGISLETPDAHNLEDRFFQEEKFQIPFEIRGKKKGMNEKDLNQLIGRLVDQEEHPTYKTRGVFVLNAYRDDAPESKGHAFEDNLAHKAIPWGICLLSTTDLYNLIVMKLSGDNTDFFKDQLFNTTGIYTLPSEAAS